MRIGQCAAAAWQASCLCTKRCTACHLALARLPCSCGWLPACCWQASSCIILCAPAVLPPGSLLLTLNPPAMCGLQRNGGGPKLRRCRRRLGCGVRGSGAPLPPAALVWIPCGPVSEGRRGPLLPGAGAGGASSKCTGGAAAGAGAAANSGGGRRGADGGRGRSHVMVQAEQCCACRCLSSQSACQNNCIEALLKVQNK